LQSACRNREGISRSSKRCFPLDHGIKVVSQVGQDFGPGSGQARA